jgi:curved DNA binding protein
VIEEVKKLIVPDAKVIDICVRGDELIAEETNKVYKGKKIPKGIAFPTCISPNACVAHLSPLTTDKEAEIVLKQGDVVKVTLGAQIDGFASSAADTVVVGADVIEGRIADAILAGWYASEAAIRTIKPGNKNTAVTKIVDQVVKAFDCHALEGMLSQQQERNVINGNKKIILNPTDSQRREFESVTFEEGEVYGVDILVSPGTGKVTSRETGTTVYKKADITYQLRLKTSRAVFSEVQKKAGDFPFSLRTLEDPKRARMGLQECQNHGLIVPYDVLYDKDDNPVVQFFTTIALTKTGTAKFAGPVTPDFAKIKSDKKIEDQELLDLLAQPLKVNKKKNKKKAAADATDDAN